MNEIYKDAIGYEDLYMVSNFGKIYGIKYKTLLKPSNNLYGYPTVSLCKNGISKSVTVHSVVAKAFIENSLSLPQINHIDENKENNRSDNLEWCTAKYNNNYGTKKSRCSKKLSKEVFQFSKDGSFLKSHYGLHNAQLETGVASANIWKCCVGERQYAGGYTWKYPNYKED